uniref:NADH dehydrogenase [ubiquinone] 1 subunit C1, mitochondrial n=1 Tax=Ficedula albicollis TaxID=59894 RepID=A0A803VC56_FICAL
VAGERAKSTAFELAAPHLLSGGSGSSFTRSASYVKKVNNGQPNWLGVGMAFGTSAALWGFLIKEHTEDEMEYERRKRERRHKCGGCS